jgi:hypothetical protein
VTSVTPVYIFLRQRLHPAKLVDARRVALPAHDLDVFARQLHLAPLARQQRLAVAVLVDQHVRLHRRAVERHALRARRDGAREEQADKLFREIIEIADDASGDYVTSSVRVFGSMPASGPLLGSRRGSILRTRRLNW